MEGDDSPSLNWSARLEQSLDEYGLGISQTFNLSLRRSELGNSIAQPPHGLRPQDHVMMLSPEWTGGGTDYGGCAGRYAVFSLTTAYNQCDATMVYEPGFSPNPLADNGRQSRRRICGGASLDGST